MKTTMSKTEGSQLDRSFAMVVAGAGAWALAAGLAAFLGYVVAVYAPALGDETFVPEVLPVFTAIMAVLIAVGTAAVFWRGARRRAWFWWIPVALAVLLLAQNAQDIPYDLARPSNAPPFFITIVVLAGALGAIAGGITAFLEVRRRRPLWTRTGRAGWLTIAVIGVALGSVMTSLLAGAVSAGGASVSTVPTSTAFMTVVPSAFAPNSFRMKSGEVLGLFISNPNEIAHSFDIDSLGIHVLLSPKSTTAVVIRPRESGRLDFYCSYHGHRRLGMVGIITVD